MPTYFAVRRRSGPAWDPARGLRSQDLWPEHAACMDAFVAAGLIVLGGPIGASAEALLVFDAPSEAAFRVHLDEDPWTASGHLEIVGIEPWTILLDGRNRP